MSDSGSEASRLVCANCGQPLGALPPSAKHKRFCSSVCRQDWHKERRASALEMLKEKEKGAGATPPEGEKE